jgi:hypothetical protein
MTLLCSVQQNSNQYQYIADAEKPCANRMRLIQDKHTNKIEPTIHIGLCNTKCQDRNMTAF